MTTKTAAPTTADEAQQLADQLRAAETNLRRRQADASRQARIAEAHRQLDLADRLAATRDQAVTAWETATRDPSVGIAELFERWSAMRLASVQRGRHVAQASGVLDQLAPRRSLVSGQAVPWRADTHDGLDAMNDFASAIDSALRQRTDAAGRAATDRVQSAIDAAGAEAAAATT